MRKCDASLTIVAPVFHNVSCPTTVTLTGSVRTSAGSFCAVTTTVGSWKGPAGDWRGDRLRKRVRRYEERAGRNERTDQHGMRVIMAK